jgi:hypothetical protein
VDFLLASGEKAMTAQEPMMATVKQMMPLSGQPNRFSFHMETNDRTTQVRPRNTINHRLKAIIVSAACTALFVVGRLRRAFWLHGWRCLTRFLGLRSFLISHAG